MFEFSLHATQGHARAGTLSLPHGTVNTPAFMPVGTHGAVRGLHPDEVRRAGAEIILGNTYHLHLRPGEAVIRELGGIQRFTAWNGPVLTDSGGFQVFSLEALRKITETGVTFQSHVDGTYRTLTPES
ncbi:MAG: tRNA guanosine(34) transglycosylase Tgt, partial [Gemmatimonadota bacterium]